MNIAHSLLDSSPSFLRMSISHLSTTRVPILWIVGKLVDFAILDHVQLPVLVRIYDVYHPY